MDQVIALHYRKSLIGQPKCQYHAPSLGQLIDLGLQRGAVQHMAQVDDECGQQNHYCAGARTHQADDNELRGAA